MGLLSRVKNRLLRARAPAGIGPGFPSSYAEEWKELEEQVDNYGQRVGAAVVQSWEVGAAELARSIRGLPGEKVLIERFSDALVPTLTPFQDLHKKTAVAMKLGFDQGTSTSQIAAANTALVGLVAGLGTTAADGWTKGVVYLEPVFAVCGEPEGARQAMLAHGPSLQAACDLAERLLVAELAKAPDRASLWVAVTDPFDLWQARLVRELEIAITNATRELAANARSA